MAGCYYTSALASVDGKAGQVAPRLLHCCPSSDACLMSSLEIFVIFVDVVIAFNFYINKNNCGQEWIQQGCCDKSPIIAMQPLLMFSLRASSTKKLIGV